MSLGERGTPQAGAGEQLARLRAPLPSGDATEHLDDGTIAPEGTNAPQGRALALVMEVLDALDAEYFLEAGDVYARWERGLFHFNELGDHGQTSILQVHGTWERYLPHEAYTRAAMFCNEWNAANAWPKAYAQVDDAEGVVGILGETTVELAGTLSVSDIEVVVINGVGPTLSLFDAAAQAFSDHRQVE